MNISTNVPTDAQRAEILAQDLATRTAKLRTFRAALDYQTSRHDQAVRDFTENITDRGLLWTLEMAEPLAATLAEADLWNQVKVAWANATTAEDADGQLPAAVASMRMILAEVERQLLRNYVHKSSSDAFVVAVSTARADGFARFHRSATELLDMMTTV